MWVWVGGMCEAGEGDQVGGDTERKGLRRKKKEEGWKVAPEEERTERLVGRPCVKYGEIWHMDMAY